MQQKKVNQKIGPLLNLKNAQNELLLPKRKIAQSGHPADIFRFVTERRQRQLAGGITNSICRLRSFLFGKKRIFFFEREKKNNLRCSISI
jgi:hypothetical protein